MCGDNSDYHAMQRQSVTSNKQPSHDHGNYSSGILEDSNSFACNSIRFVGVGGASQLCIELFSSAAVFVGSRAHHLTLTSSIPRQTMPAPKSREPKAPPPVRIRLKATPKRQKATPKRMPGSRTPFLVSRAEHDMFEPIPGAVMCSGKRQRHFGNVQEMIEEQPRWLNFDVARELPRDPYSGGVSTHENGTFPVTIVQVMAQENLPNVVKNIVMQLISHLLGGPGGANIYCVHGHHRSDVVMRLVAEILNSCTSANNTRLFNIQMFPLNTSYGSQGQANMINDAAKWPLNPWTTIPGGVHVPTNYLYGALESSSNSRAYSNFLELVEWRGKGLHEFIDDELASRLGEDHPMCKRAAPVAPPEPPTFNEEEQRFAAQCNVEVSDEGTDRPAWASLGFNVQKWWEFMDEWELDMTSRRALFFLAQMGERGKYQAIDILSKLSVKGWRGEIRDVNKWFHSSVSSARMRLVKDLGMWCDDVDERKLNEMWDGVVEDVQSKSSASSSSTAPKHRRW